MSNSCMNSSCAGILARSLVCAVLAGSMAVAGDKPATPGDASVSTENSVVPRLGTLEGMTMIPFRPHPGDGGPKSEYFGAPYHDTWVSAIVRDDAGRTYWLMQTDNVDGQDIYLAVESGTAGDYMQPIPGIKSGMPRPVNFELGTAKELEYSTPDGSTLKLTVTESSFKWVDAGVADLKGRLAAPGVQLIMPFQRGEDAGVQLYTAQHYVAEGTLLGKPVKGFVLFEHNYSQVPWAQGAFNENRGALVAFSNEYDDGSIESGYFYCGRDTVAVLSNSRGQKLVDTQSVKVDADVDPNGALVKALYTLGDGSQWQFTRDRGASMDRRAFGPPPAAAAPENKVMPPAALSFGRVVRVGETRKLVNWWSSSESGTQPGKPCVRAKPAN